MSGYIGQDVPRVEGPAKVTGSARYSGEITLPDLAYAEIVGATVASGQVTSIDTTAAERTDGVIAVLTLRDMPKISHVPLVPSLLGGPAPGETFFPVQDDAIHYAGQPVAIVVADTLEQAQHAATLVRGEVRRNTIHYHDRPGPRARLPAGADLRWPHARADGTRGCRRRVGGGGCPPRRGVPVRRQPPQRAGTADHHGGMGGG